jgi:hypothetical protein
VVDKKLAQEILTDLDKFTDSLGVDGAKFIQKAYEHHAKEVLKKIECVKFTY